MLRLKQIPTSFYPIVYLLAIGIINELLCYFIFRSTAIPVNIYYIIEYLLYCWQFHNWRHILKGKYLLLAMGSMLLYWITDELVLEKITSYTSLYLIVYPFLLVLYAVNELNYIVTNELGNVFKNPVFIFCIAVIIYYCYRILTEIFYHYAIKPELHSQIFGIQMYVNVLFNILLTLVVLCLPKKRIITPP